MLTLITGVPGSGKTAHIVEMILAELRQERKIYVQGIPDLVAQHRVPDPTQPGGFRVFACEQAGNPRTWHKGTWLNIDTYERPEESTDEWSQEQIDGDEGASAWKPNGNGSPDKGALIIIDECQTYYRPRSSGSRVPDFIAAFEVHRHQGLDFWLLTQRPALLDGNLRGLISRHIHIHTTAFGRKRLEWAECQDPSSRQARGIAHRTNYKPNPEVFGLYRSATVHTKLKIKLPNQVYILAACAVVLVAMVGLLYSRISDRINPVTEAQASVNPSQVAGPTAPQPPEGDRQPERATRATAAGSSSVEVVQAEPADNRVLIVGYLKTDSGVFVMMQDAAGHQFDARDVSESFQLRADGALINKGRLYRIGSTFEVVREVPQASPGYGHPKTLENNDLQERFSGYGTTSSDFRGSAPMVSHRENGQWISEPL